MEKYENFEQLNQAVENDKIKFSPFFFKIFVEIIVKTLAILLKYATQNKEIIRKLQEDVAELRGEI